MSRIYKILMMAFSLTVLMFACSEKEEEPTEAELTVRESERRVSFTNAAGSVSVAVTASGTYTATVKTGEDWCTVSDVGNQGFKVNVSENTARAQRTAEIILASPGCTDVEIVVTQLGLEPALIIDNWYKIVSFSRSGGDTVVAVTANGEYTVTVEGNPEWCTVSKVATGFKISVTTNTGTEERSAKITVSMTGTADVEITVIQGATAILSVSDEDKSLGFSVTGGDKTVIVITSGKYDVAVEGNPEWCTLSDTTKSNFKINVSQNFDLDTRSAKIVITIPSQEGVPPVEIVVTQAPAPLKVSPSQITFNSGLAGEETVTVSSKIPGFTFTADIADSWITPEINGATLKLKVDAPPFDGSGRTSRVVVSTGGDSAELYVTQLACLDKSLMGAHYVGDDNRTIFDPG
ncbi:MAG: hypothetical protein LBQ01_08985, partial [Prevotellaceae bacterium]|nr:hypothetical protein [Prevotellaceae bacterium]